MCGRSLDYLQHAAPGFDFDSVDKVSQTRLQIVECVVDTSTWLSLVLTHLVLRSHW